MTYFTPYASTPGARGEGYEYHSYEDEGGELQSMASSFTGTISFDYPKYAITYKYAYDQYGQTQLHVTPPPESQSKCKKTIISIVVLCVVLLSGILYFQTPVMTKTVNQSMKSIFRQNIYINVDELNINAPQIPHHHDHDCVNEEFIVSMFNQSNKHT
eukprot:UN02229